MQIEKTGRTIAAAAAGVMVIALAAGAARPWALGSQAVDIEERNKAAALRWSTELWSAGNLAVADEIIAADYVRHDPGDPFPARGPEDVKRIVTMLRSMFPDFHIEVEAQIAEGDIVVSRYTATATDTRGYMGYPPTGRRIRTSAIQIFRFADGRVVESWAARDDLGTLRQLGHLDLPAGPPRR